MDFDFIRFGWPNVSFIAALAIIPLAVLIAPVATVTHAQANSQSVLMSTASAQIVID